MKTKLFIALIMLALGGCVSTQAVLPTSQLIDNPPLNTVHSVELGETVVEKGRLRTFAGLVLANELRWGDGLLLKRFTVSPGRLRARQMDQTFTYFFSENMTAYDALLGTTPYVGGGICRRNDGAGPLRGFIVAGRCDMNWNTTPDVSETQIYDLDSPSFRQEFIYNGRSGNTLRFLYREFSGDVMRPPFSQEVQYDLSEGNTVGFRGVRLEVVNATNTQLTYRVISSFPDQ